MLQPSSLSRSMQRAAITCICLLSSISLISSCKNKQPLIRNDQFLQDQEMSRLRLRIEQLERQIGSNQSTNSSSINVSKSSGPIKSITFRIGSKDDRLRIYWADGSNTDLPCTKEQSIWACG